MNDEFIEEIVEETTDNASVSSNESVDEFGDISSINSVSEDNVYVDIIYEDISEVVVDDVFVEDNNLSIDDSFSFSESNESPIIDYSVSLDNIVAKLDDVVVCISENRVDYVYDYNYNIVSILLLSAVVGVLLFSLFTRRF